MINFDNILFSLQDDDDYVLSTGEERDFDMVINSEGIPLHFFGGIAVP